MPPRRLAPVAQIGILLTTSMRSLVRLICVTMSLSTAFCVREHVDLNRPCTSDNDCIDGYACQNGTCTSTDAKPDCQIGEPEVCDGIDNNCNGVVDEGFSCALGSEQSCSPEAGKRYCIPGCSYSGCFTDWYDGHYPQRVLLTIPSGTTSTPLTDVPVPVHLTTAQFTTAGVDPTTLSTDGHDITITDNAGTPLPFQIESWDATRGYVVWVKLPTLANNADTSLYLYLGNINGNVGSTPTVWDSGFVGVWHLAETGDISTFADATGNGNDALGRHAKIGGGPIGSGQTIAPGSGLRASAVAVPAGTAFTIEGWLTVTDEAFHYRRPLNATVPEDDFEVLWPVSSSGAFATRLGDVSKAAVVDAADGLVPYALLSTAHGQELWYRVATAGARSPALLYGDPGADDFSNPLGTFHFFAYGNTWQQFTPDDSALATPSGTSLVMSSGRLAATLPFDVRDGYLVQTYADTSPPSTPGTDAAGVTPFIASSANPDAGNPTADSFIIVQHTRVQNDATFRTSSGGSADIDQGAEMVPAFGDIGIGVYNGSVTAIADQVAQRTFVSNWAKPLNTLMLGSYSQSVPFYETTYELVIVYKWKGATTTATLGRERVNGLALGDFAITVGRSQAYVSTNQGITTIGLPGGVATPTHHVALVVSGTSYQVFIDGAASSSGAVSAFTDLQELHLIDVRALDGVLDEVRVSNVARSQAELALEVRSARSNFLTVGTAQTLH